MKQFGLFLRGPSDSTRPLAVAKSGPVECYHPVVEGQAVEQAAHLPIGRRERVPMQQDDRRSHAALEVMQFDPADVRETPQRRIGALGLPRGARDEGGRRGKGYDGARGRDEPKVGCAASFEFHVISQMAYWGRRESAVP